MEELEEAERIRQRNIENAKIVKQQAEERNERFRKVREEEIISEESELNQKVIREQRITDRAVKLINQYEKVH